MKTEQRNYPVQKTVYCLKYIMEKLYLRDSACLLFEYNGKGCCIQDSHISDQEILSIPHFSESLWEYQYETDEWIPVFKYVSSNPITDFVDIELDTDPYRQSNVEYWATPKGFPREQWNHK